MAEEKTQCKNCGAAIQLWTAERTGGLCMPCKTGGPRPPDPNEPFEISCTVEDADWELVFVTTAQELLARLERVRHVGDESHPNKLELAAQRALLRFGIWHRTINRLHDDQWSQTGRQLLALFEEGRAVLKKGGRTYRFDEITKEEWQSGKEPLMSRGGFRYVDAAGNELLRRMMWMT